MKYLIVVGSKIGKRYVFKLAKEITDILSDYGSVELISTENELVDEDKYHEQSLEVRKKFEGYDAYILITPIHTGTYSASMKNFLDLTGYKSLMDKPVLVAGNCGTDKHMLALTNLQQLVINLQGFVYPKTICSTGNDFDNSKISSSIFKEHLGNTVYGFKEFAEKLVE